MATINKQMKTFNVPSGSDTKCYEIVDDKGRKCLAKDWATNSSAAYAAGEYVIKDGVVYKFKTAHTAGAAWSSSEVEETNLGDEITDLKSTIGTVPTGKTVEGQIEELQTGKADVIDVTPDTPSSVMTFSDGADGIPIKVGVKIEPDQYLYGMPYPYPAGVTNNMIPEGTDTNNGYVDGKYLKYDGTEGSYGLCYISEYFSVTAGETYTMSNILANGGDAGVCFYNSNKEYISGVKAEQVQSKTFTAPSGATYARCTQAKKIGYLMGVYMNIWQFEVGSTATTPMWYSNICPISGWTGEKMFVKKKNLVNISTCTRYDPATNSVSADGNFNDIFGDVSGNTKAYPLNKLYKLPFLKAGTYTISYTASGTSKRNVIVYIVDESTGNVTQILNVNNSYGYHAQQFTLNKGTYITIRISGSSYNVADLMIERGSVATSYEPYAGSDYSIIFPVGAGTVYGGMLEVYKDGTGKLAVDRGIEIVDGVNNKLTWLKSGNAAQVFRKMKPANSLEKGELCNKLETGGASTDSVANGKRTWYAGIRGSYIYVDTDNETITTQEQFDAWCQQENLQIVYELATPIEYDMTASEVNALLTSLKGVNNIWADTGDILSVEYSADTKLYVDQQIAEKVSASQRLMELIVTANREDTMTATKAYSSGDLLIVNGTLYKASTSIANGATLTEGTNVTATTVAVEIAALA